MWHINNQHVPCITVDTISIQSNRRILKVGKFDEVQEPQYTVEAFIHTCAHDLKSFYITSKKNNAFFDRMRTHCPIGAIGSNFSSSFLFLF